jgi:hypothetical protein
VLTLDCFDVEDGGSKLLTELAIDPDDCCGASMMILITKMAVNSVIQKQLDELKVFCATSSCQRDFINFRIRH